MQESNSIVASTPDLHETAQVPSRGIAVRFEMLQSILVWGALRLQLHF